jgi:O-antigen/teichoic acid export membrane protein
MSTESAKFERQGAHTLITTALAVALGLLLSIVAARTLGPAGKGVLDLTSATAGLFTLLLGLSLNVGITHLVARRGQMPAGLPWQMAWWSAGAGLLTALLLVCWPEFSTRLGLLPFHDHPFWIGFVAVTVTFGVWGTGLRGVLVGEQRLVTVNRIEVAVKAALLAGYAGLALTLPANPQLFALVGIGGALVLPFFFLGSLRGPVGPAAKTWPALLALALPVHGTNILHFFNQRIDLFFVQSYHGSSEVALYALAVSLAQVVLLLSSALAQPLLSQVSTTGDAADTSGLTARTCRMFVALGLAVAAALALGSGWLVPHVFGRDFSGSLPALLVLLPGMIAFGLTNIIISHFVGIGDGRINLWISLAAFVVTLAGNAWLTPRYGALGAAVTSTLAYSVAGGLSVAVFLRRAGGSAVRLLWPGLADWKGAVALVTRFRP